MQIFSRLERHGILCERFVSPTVRLFDHRLEGECEGVAGPLPGQLPALAFIRSGALDLRYGSRRVLVDPTQMMLLNWGTPYTFKPADCTRGCCVTTLHLGQRAVGEISAALGFAVEPAAPFGAPVVAGSPDLAHALYLLIAATRAGGPADRMAEDVARRCSRLVFAAALRRSHGIGEGSSSCLNISELARRVRELLVKRAPEGAPLVEIASALGTSRYHVCRTFSTEIGLTMGQYLQRLRITQALYRLAEGERNLTALALDLGYSSHSHLTSVFRRIVGRPPSKLWGRARNAERVIPPRILELGWGAVKGPQRLVPSSWARALASGCEVPFRGAVDSEGL